MFCIVPSNRELDGGAKRDRTADLLHAMQALSQLSYSPKQNLLDAGMIFKARESVNQIIAFPNRLIKYKANSS